MKLFTHPRLAGLALLAALSAKLCDRCNGG